MNKKFVYQVGNNKKAVHIYLQHVSVHIFSNELSPKNAERPNGVDGNLILYLEQGGSNIIPDTMYPGGGFSWLSPVRPDKSCD